MYYSKKITKVYRVALFEKRLQEYHTFGSPNCTLRSQTNQGSTENQVHVKNWTNNLTIIIKKLC